MRVDVNNIGQYIADQPGWQLPPEAITKAQNVRWADNQVGTVSGYSTFFTSTQAPYFVMPVTDGSSFYWLYMSLTDGFIFDGSSSTEITRATGGDYTGSASDRWNGCIINGVPVVNNGVDDPQMFTPIQTSTDLQLLTGWNTNWKAEVIRQYKNFLVAINVTKSSVVYPHMVKWSDVADSGTVPDDWDETSTVNLAGETHLSETDGVLVDGVQLKDELILYKEDAVYGMQYVGGSFVFRFRRIRGLGGILAQNCAIEFQGGHFVVGGPNSYDIYIHDGQTAKSIADTRVRDAFFSDLDQDNYASTFVVPHFVHNEILICYPSSGSSLPDKALVWNYMDDKWSFRDLPANTTCADVGIVNISAYSWATLPYATWDEWTDTWGTRQYSPVNDTLVMGSTDLDFYKLEDGNQFDGVDAQVIVERVGLDVGNTSDVHLVKTIYPYIEGNALDIYVGSQMSPNEAIDWSGPYSFDPSTDYKVDVRKTGRLHSIRFTSQGNVQWGLSGFGVDVELVGRR